LGLLLGKLLISKSIPACSQIPNSAAAFDTAIDKAGQRTYHWVTVPKISGEAAVLFEVEKKFNFSLN